MANPFKYAANLEPTVRLGKTGLSKGQLSEIEKQLKKRKIIKVKMLKSYVTTLNTRSEIDEVAHIVAGIVGAQVVSNIGNTFVIAKGNPTIKPVFSGKKRK